MGISSQVAFLHEAIGVQRAALRFQKYLAMGVGFLGLLPSWRRTSLPEA
jgi:hypothetical protein